MCNVLTDPCQQFCQNDGTSAKCSCSSYYDKINNTCHLKRDEKCNAKDEAFCLDNGQVRCKENYIPNDNGTCVPGE